MTLNQLQYFYQAAKTQHFNHAADNLSISQPSLSRAIASLENELGVILFERMGRNVSLTKAGQVFLEQTEKILEDIAVAERKMHQLAASGGEISIAYVFPLSMHFCRIKLNNPTGRQGCKVYCSLSNGSSSCGEM